MQLPGFQFHTAWQPYRGYTAGMKFFSHAHAFYELGIVISGHCEWRLKRHKTVLVETGEGILVAPHEPHREQPLSDCRLAWVGFAVPKEELRGVRLNRPLRLRHHFPEIKALIERMEAEQLLNLGESEWRMQLLVAELAILLRRTVSGEPQKTRSGGPNARQVESAALYLERNCMEALTLEQVARYHGLSYSHFSALFRSRFGISPKVFQQRSKLRHLEEVAGAGVTEIKALAEAGRFEDVAYFCRWLKRQTGLRPTEWIGRCASLVESPVLRRSGELYANPKSR